MTERVQHTWCYSSHTLCTYILVLFVEHVSFSLQSEVIVGKIRWFVFPRENQLRQQTSARSHAVLLIQSAEQIPLSCLSSWKFESLPCDLHFLNQIQVSGRRWRSSTLLSWEVIGNLHDMIKIMFDALLPLDQRQSFIGMAKRVRVWETHVCHYVRAAPHPDLLASEFIKGLALLHRIVFPVRRGVCSLLTCCAWMQC